MLNSFWNSLELEDISDLNYTSYEPYPTEEQKENVIVKLDLVKLKLHKIKDQRRYDYDVVSILKNRIEFNDWSLTSKGVDFLNDVANGL